MRTSAAPPGEPLVELAPWIVSLERWIFRGSQGSEYGKDLRWSLETSFSPWFFERRTHRNQVMQSRVDLYENRDPTQTDILQEYFVPRERLEEFLRRVRAVVPAHAADLQHADPAPSDRQNRNLPRPILSKYWRNSFPGLFEQVSEGRSGASPVSRQYPPAEDSPWPLTRPMTRSLARTFAPLCFTLPNGRSARSECNGQLAAYSLIPQRGIPTGRLRIACRQGVSAEALLFKSVSGEAGCGATKPEAKNASWFRAAAA